MLYLPPPERPSWRKRLVDVYTLVILTAASVIAASVALMWVYLLFTAVSR